MKFLFMLLVTVLLVSCTSQKAEYGHKISTQQESASLNAITDDVETFAKLKRAQELIEALETNIELRDTLEYADKVIEKFYEAAYSAKDAARVSASAVLLARDPLACTTSIEKNVESLAYLSESLVQTAIEFDEAVARMAENVGSSSPQEKVSLNQAVSNKTKELELTSELVIQKSTQLVLKALKLKSCQTTEAESNITYL